MAQAALSGSKSKEELQSINEELTTINQEEERRHIARELHDQMGQDLTALLLEIKALQNAAAADASIAGRVAQVQVLAMQML